MAIYKEYISDELTWGFWEAAEKQSPTYYLKFSYDPKKTIIKNIKVDMTLWWEGTRLCPYSWANVYLNGKLIYKVEWSSGCESRQRVYDIKEFFERDNFIEVKAYHDRRLAAATIFEPQSKLKYNITIVVEYTGIEPRSEQESKPPGWRPRKPSEKIQEFLTTPVAIGVIGAISTFVLLWLFRRRK
jgi:hypothetical protein